MAPYIFPLNPDYVAARSLRSLRSKNVFCGFFAFVYFNLGLLLEIRAKNSAFALVQYIEHSHGIVGSVLESICYTMKKAH